MKPALQLLIIGNRIALVHSAECWYRMGHSCSELPLNLDMLNFNKDILHVFIGSVVLGDISEPGCFMDWSSFTAIIEQNTKAKSF